MATPRHRHPCTFCVMDYRVGKASVKVGVIGFGLAGRVFHAPLISAVSELQLKTICSKRHDEIRAFYPGVSIVKNVQEVLGSDEIDLVVIATPTETHEALAEKALLAGKHVVVDKPLALSRNAARSLFDLAKVENRRLFAFHNRRWDTDFMGVRDAISKDLLGDVTFFESRIDRFRPHVKDRWREDGSVGSGIWYDLGPHLVDQALLLFDRPHAVTADIACLRPGANADDCAHVILHYPGKRIILHASLVSPDGVSGGQPRFSVSGTVGSLIKRSADPQEAQLQQGVRPGDQEFGIDEDRLQLHRPGLPINELQCPRGQQHHFYQMLADCVLRGGEEPVTRDQLIGVCEIIDAANQSATERRTVELFTGSQKEAL
jgi:predicted dehydrogenase